MTRSGPVELVGALAGKFSRLLKKVFEAVDARRTRAKKPSLRPVNKYFEPDFNAAAVTQIVFQKPAGSRVCAWALSRRAFSPDFGRMPWFWHR